MQDNSINDLIGNINNKKDFLKFVKLLENDFIKNKHKWENNSTDQFIESIGGYCHDSDEYTDNDISRNQVALLLYSGKFYE